MSIQSINNFLPYELKHMVIERITKDATIEILYHPERMLWEIKFTMLGKKISKLLDIEHIGNIQNPEKEQVTSDIANVMKSGFKL